MPFSIAREQGGMVVDWCYIGKARFCEPFFEDTIRKQMREPFSQLFSWRTPFAYLKELSERLPVIEPSGFIFHLSRCGSTLISQMLAALPENIVISEAPPIDFVIRKQDENFDADVEKRANNLKWLINVFGRKRNENEKNLFIKFDCWHTLDLELITQVFPRVPWIFLYRNPVEIIVSHLRQPGMQMISGAIKGLMPEADLKSLSQMSRAEYCARVLGAICQPVLKHAEKENALMINYSQLPEAVNSKIIKHFKVAYSAKSMASMNDAAQFNAKAPQLSFSPDAREKNKEATEMVRQCAEEFVAPCYRELENIRLVSGE